RCRAAACGGRCSWARALRVVKARHYRPFRDALRLACGSGAATIRPLSPPPCPMRPLIALLLLVLALPAASAAEPAPAGTPGQAAPVPVREFFQPAEFSNLTLSPDGRHLLATVRRENQWSLVVLRVEDGVATVNLQLGEQDYVSSMRWKDENQFVFSVDKLTGSLLNDLRFIYMTRWYVGKADGS